MAYTIATILQHWFPTKSKNILLKTVQRSTTQIIHIKSRMQNKCNFARCPITIFVYK